MPESWANLGIDLLLEPAGRGVRAGLEQGLRDAIQAGRLLPGTRLPSTRTLAGDLGIARNTIAQAYGQLVAEGWLDARRGSGTRVSEHAVGGQAPQAEPEPSARIRHDLRPGRPDLGLFPRAAWLGAARRALAAAPDAELGYGDPRGAVELRRVLAEYLGRVRGVRATPERIVVCSGFVQALALICRVARDRGARRLAVEEYGLAQHREVAVAAGLELVPLAVDGEGAVVDGCDGAGLVLLTPAHQFPLGVPLAPDRRRRALEWAGAARRTIVEDDYDGEFRYDRRAVGAMQALAPELVVYAGTASKSLAPGLRLGWLVAPPELVAPLAQAKALAGAGGSVLDQLTLAQLIGSGDYDRHIRRCRIVYQRRRDALVAALRRDAPEARVAGVAAGLHVVVELPEGVCADAVVARAARTGLAVESLASYGLGGGTRRPALVVGYATPPEHAFTAAVARLTAAIAGRE